MWVAVTRPVVTFECGSTLRGRTAALLLVYSALYPLLVWLTGFSIPRAPVFAVPCPTVILTAGILLAGRPAVPQWLYVVPIVWAIIGGSAAFLFHMTPDLALLMAGAALVMDAVAARRSPDAVRA